MDVASHSHGACARLLASRWSENTGCWCRRLCIDCMLLVHSWMMSDFWFCLVLPRLSLHCLDSHDVQWKFPSKQHDCSIFYRFLKFIPVRSLFPALKFNWVVHFRTIHGIINVQVNLLLCEMRAPVHFLRVVQLLFSSGRTTPSFQIVFVSCVRACHHFLCRCGI